MVPFWNKMAWNIHSNDSGTVLEALVWNIHLIDNGTILETLC
jgi:hypothetical protein